MDDKNQNITGVIYPNDGDSQSMSALPVAPEPTDFGAGALSDPSFASTDPTVSQAQAIRRAIKPLLKWVGAVAVVLLMAGGIFQLLGTANRGDPRVTNVNPAASFDSQTIPLESLEVGTPDQVFTARQVAVNGQLRVGEGLVLTPSLQPSTPQPGQLYYDQGTNLLGYFNGTEFVFLDDSGSEQPTNFVESIAGLTGQIGLGGGLAVASGQLINGGVLSVQGQTGAVNFVGGNGIAINGTTINSTGVVGITSLNPAVIVGDDGNGNLTLDFVGGGTGTVSSIGGTNGRIAKFTGAQTIADSLLSETGSVVTLNGDLSVTGAVSLGTPLSVANGGTGTSNLSVNGVLVGNNGGAITSVVAGGAGMCLTSTGGAPVWASCTNSGNAVTSLNGLGGSLTIANATGLVNTITIDDASTLNKGIAQFNNTNFTDDGNGLINTIQNINISASPVFNGLTLSGDIAVNGGDITSTGALNITPGGTLTAGSATQALSLQGNASSVFTVTSGGNTTTLSFQAPGANVNYRFPTASAGNYDVCTTSGNCGIGAGTVSTSGGTPGVLPVFDGTFTVADSLVSQSGGTVTVDGNLNLTGGNQYQINGVAISSADLSNDANLAKLNASQTFTGNNIVFQNGSNSATAFAIQNASGNRIAAIDTSNGELELGQGSTLAGRLVLANATNNNTITLVTATATADRTITFPDESGVVCLDSGNCSGTGATLQSAYNNSTDPEIVVDSTRGALTLRDNATPLGANLFEVQNNAGSTTYFSVTATGVNITGTATVSGDINSSGGTIRTDGTSRIDNSGNLVNIGTLTLSGAISGGTSFTGSGNINTSGGSLQTNNITRIDNSGNLTNIASLAASGNATLQGGTVTLGTAAQTGSLVLFDGSSNTGTLQVAALGQDTVYELPDPGAGTATICLSTGNCASSGGGVTTLGGTPGTLPVFTGAQTLGDSLVSESGGTVSVNGNLNISGGGVVQTAGTTRLDASGNLTNIGTLTLSGAISGGTTISSSGNINTTGGDIQTDSTTRIDNSGNLTNIGTITASGSATLQGGSLILGTTSQAGSILIYDGSSNTGTLEIAALGQNTVFTLPDPGSGTATICLTTGNCAGVGGSVAGSGTANRLSKFTVTGSTIGDSTITDDGTTVTTSVDLVIQGGEATIGVSTTQTGSLIFADSSSAFLGTIVQGGLGGDRTYTLPDASGEICLSSGNCLGGGGGGANTALSNLTSVAINTTLLPGSAGTVHLGSATLPFGDLFLAGSSGTPGTNNFHITGASTSGTRVITLPDATGTVCLQSSASCGFAPSSGSTSYIQNQIASPQTADFNISGDGLAATFNGTTGINTGSGGGTQRIDASGNLVNIADITLSGAIAGTGDINTSGGALQTNGTDRVDNSGNLVNIGTLTLSGAISGGTSFTGSGNINTTGGAIQTAGTTRIDNSGNLTNIGNLTAAGSATLQGGTVTLGTLSQAGALVLHDGAGQTGSIVVDALGQTTTYTLPDPGGATAEICLSSGNCLGPGGSGANIALSNLAGVAINTTLLPDAAAAIDLGSAALPFGELFLAGTSSSPDTNNFQITGVSTGGTRTITLPDASGTVCINTNNCNYAPGSGSANYIQNQIASPQTGADFNIDGQGRAATFNASTGINTGAGAGTQRIDASGNLVNIGTLTLSGAISGGTSFTGSGNINTTGGALQTNSTTRIDLSGNLTNIGNLTATGAITIASTGGGNDIIIDGADQFIVQDAAVFNGTGTFNNDVDFTLADTENIGITNTVTGTNGVNLINAALTNNTSSGTQQIAVLQNAGGSGVTDALLLLDNADADTAVTSGLIVTSAAGGITTALDVSDADIVTAISIGANDIAGTNFSVDGASGDVAGGTYNGQTLSASANFTGTLTVANDLTLTSGDLAVNGGDITSTGALSITPTGTLTVGATGQVLTLQGNANTTLTATDSGNTTTIGFVTPAANTTLNFPALTGGPYEICTSQGNCLGAGVTLQAAYNNSTSPEFTLDNTRGGLTIRDNSTPIGSGSGNLLEVQNNAQSTTYFAVNSVGASVTGTITSNNTISNTAGNINAGAGAIQTAGNNRIDVSGNLVNIGNLTGSGTITIASTGAGNDVIINGADQFIVQDAAVFNATATFSTEVDLVLADTENLDISSTVTGTNSVNLLNTTLTNNSSSGTQQLALLQNAAGSGVTEALLALDNADSDTAVTAGIVITTAAGGITNALDVSDPEIVNALLFGANDISGTNFAVDGGTGNITTSGTYNTNTFTGDELTFGAAGTATIQPASGQALTITANASSTWSTSSGDLSLQAASALNLGNGGGSAINIGTNAAAHTISIGTNSGGDNDITIGSANAGSTLLLQGGTASNAIALATGASGGAAGGIVIGNTTGADTQTISIGTNATASSNTTVNIGSAIGSSTTNINSGTGNINLQVAGAGTTGLVQIGAGGSGSTTPDLLGLDVKSDAGDPAGVNGAMYYNENLGKFRCYQGGTWRDCIAASAAEYLRAERTTFQDGTEVDSTSDHVNFDNVQASSGSGVTLDTSSPYTEAGGASQGRFTLAAGRTYKLRGTIGSVSFNSSTGYVIARWYDVTSGTALGSAGEMFPSTYSSTHVSSSSLAEVIFTASTTTIVELRLVDLADVASISDATLSAFALIEVVSDGSQIAQFVGATDSTDGQSGFVPAPLAGQEGSLLVGDGAWSNGLTYVGGMLGIGRTDPFHILDVEDVAPIVRIQSATNNATGSALRFTETDNYQGAFLRYDGDANAFHIGVHGNDNDVLGDDDNAITILRSNGNVGIGNSSPSGVLDVLQNDGAGNSSFFRRDSGQYLELRTNASANGLFGFSNSGNGKPLVLASDTNSTGIQFYTGATTTTNGTLRLTIDSTTGNITVGQSNTTGTLLILDTKTGSGDPTGTNGGMYYNSNAGKFRCYENSSWYNCVSGVVSTASAGVNSPGTKSTGTFSNYTYPGVAVTKQAASTKLLINVHTSMYLSGSANTAVELAVLIGGATYSCTNFFFNTLAEHTQVSCSIVVSPAAGSLTAQLRWRVALGSGTLTTDPADYTSITIVETY